MTCLDSHYLVGIPLPQLLQLYLLRDLSIADGNCPYGRCLEAVPCPQWVILCQSLTLVALSLGKTNFVFQLILQIPP